MADVQVRVRRIESLLDTQPTLTGQEEPPEVLTDDDLRHTARQELVELGLGRSYGHRLSLESRTLRDPRHAIMRSVEDRTGTASPRRAGSAQKPRSYRRS